MKCRVVQAMLTAMLAGMLMEGLAQKNYYVVVGAFSTDENARNFTTYLPNLNPDTAYAMTNSNQDVVHLYVLRTPSQEVAHSRSMLLQQTLEKSDDGIKGNYEAVSVSNLPEHRSVTVTRAIGGIPDPLLSEASSARASDPSGAGPSSMPSRPAGQVFKFTISDHRGQLLPGKVHYVDLERERDLASYAAHVYTSVLNAGKNPGTAVVCALFGYKVNERYINHEDPSMITGAYLDDNGAWVIPYRLERLEKGDVSVMYNVAFYKDAVVMLPNSQTDLQELVTMMKENPWYEITVHGHSNGKHDRKIIALDEEGDLFDIKNAREVFGTAKDLSALRADAIRNYLIKNGIDRRRIRIYAWGGRYTLVDPAGPASKLNDRIEIEIRKD